jgi:hypothetical protein
VQGFSAFLGVVAMLVALLTAPLFHSHDHDDHGSDGSLIHAHVPDSHEGESHSGDEIDSSGDHHQARWIDFFTLQIPPDAFALAVDFTQDRTAPILEQSEGVILPSEPRAHSPPATRFSVPRSPPAI